MLCVGSGRSPGPGAELYTVRVKRAGPGCCSVSVLRTAAASQGSGAQPAERAHVMPACPDRPVWSTRLLPRLACPCRRPRLPARGGIAEPLSSLRIVMLCS
ncbi:unnamed protein product [Lepidochelys kempii]